MTTKTIPEGHWEDAKGRLIPENLVKPIDKLRDQLVRDQCAKAKAHTEVLRKFKLDAMAEIAAFVSMSLSEYDVKQGGEKGNVTLYSYDGHFKIVRQVSDTLVFGEQLLAAKAKIDECVQEWAKDSNDNIKVLVNHAFQTDKAGKINTDRVLSLRQLDIKDENWLLAMQAIADSMQTASSKPYVRLYERVDLTGEYLPITLNVAAL